MAAGQGFKTFITGEVLTAGDVNGYLMQGINVFTNATARDAAITAPAEGQFAFTKDNNSLWYYDGAAWVASGATGDIEGVTAGVGISGGGTSGTVTVTNSMATAIDAKGDLVPGTGADTFARLPVGTNGQILSADSAEATGLKWTTPGGGAVVQVKSFYNTTTTTQTTAGAFIDTNLTLNITPTSASNKILVIATFGLSGVSASGFTFDQGAAAQVVRGATALAESSTYFYVTNNGYGYQSGVTSALTYLDSPATTSSTTYKMQMKKNAGNGGTSSGSFTGQSITLIEVTP